MANLADLTGDAVALTGVGTWDLIWDPTDATNGDRCALTRGNVSRTFEFLAKIGRVALRITPLHLTNAGYRPENLDTDTPVTRGVYVGDRGAMSKIEAQALSTGATLSWRPVL